MTGAHKGVHQCDAGSRFSSAGGHDEQEQAAIPLNTLHHGSDGLELIVTAGNGRVNQLVGERDFMLPNVEQPFKVLPGRKAMDFLRRGYAEIPKENFVTIGVEAERQFAAVFLLAVVAILFALFAPQFRIFGRLLGLNES